MKLLIAVSNGEILDKYSILSIKAHKVTDSLQRQDIYAEMIELEGTANVLCEDTKVHLLYNKLVMINQKLWGIEDSIREKEKAKDFGQEFIDLARMVYMVNDERGETKRMINEASGSELREVKNYTRYKEEN